MNFFITSPHSGEGIPPGASWLTNLPEPILMADVDRFVNLIYADVAKNNNLSFIESTWHRYAADLNRLPSDVDSDSVKGHKNPSGTHSDGLHWVKTKQGSQLMNQPMSLQLHESILEQCYYPFHNKVAETYADLLASSSKAYQLDAHSMPSVGTNNHRDPGETRAEVVISDQDGASCSDKYTNLVVASYRACGFEVKLNWPYKGGRITQTYGQPIKGQHCIQVELNRSLYMNESTKKIKPVLFNKTKAQVERAVKLICEGIPKL